MTGVQHLALDVERAEEGRHRVADDAVVRRERRGRDRLVPDLAETSVVPADQIVVGLRRRGGGERGEGNGSGGAEHGNAKHGEWLLLGNVGWPATNFAEVLLAGRGDNPDTH